MDLSQDGDEQLRHHLNSCYQLITAAPTLAVVQFEKLITAAKAEYVNGRKPSEIQIRRYRCEIARSLLKAKEYGCTYEIFSQIGSLDTAPGVDTDDVTSELVEEITDFAVNQLYKKEHKIKEAKELFKICERICRVELEDKTGSEKCQAWMKKCDDSLPKCRQKGTEKRPRTASGLLSPSTEVRRSKSSSSVRPTVTNSNMLSPTICEAQQQAEVDKKPRSLSLPREHKDKDKLRINYGFRDHEYHGFWTETGSFMGSEDTDDANWFGGLKLRTLKILETPPRRKSGNIKIAILDTGIDGNHKFFEDFVQQIKAFKSWTEPDREIGPVADGLRQRDFKYYCTDKSGHGSFVASLVLRVATRADVYIAQVASGNDSLQSRNVASAIEHAIKVWKVDIISMSLGFPTQHLYAHQDIRAALKLTISDAKGTPKDEQIEHHGERRVLVFAAASNIGSNVPEGQGITFPACEPGVICVDATRESGLPWDRNPNPKSSRKYGVCTMGVNVQGPWPVDGVENNIRVASATSYATPVAAGIAALLLEFLLQEWQVDKVPDIFDQLRDANTGLLEHVLKERAHLYEKVYSYIAPWQWDLDLYKYPDMKRARQESLATIKKVLYGQIPGV